MGEGRGLRFGDMRIKIFTTGGSLDKRYSTRDSAFLVMDPQVAGILEAANVTVQYQIESLLRKDSLEITGEDRELILRRVKEDPCSHILITHGTDTMAVTGKRLSEISGKTIVLTGAMQPAAFKDSDAPFNVGFALAALQILPPGVYLAMNGQIFDPHHVRKDTEKDRFEAEE
jgi:L-asparaginase